MARKPETKFITRVHRHIPSSVHVECMGGFFSNGTPDRFYEGQSTDLFVEYKYLTAAKPRFVVPNLSPLQRKWAARRYANNQAVAVIVGNPIGGVLFLYNDWDTEVSGAAFAAAIQSPQELASWITSVTMEGAAHAKPNPLPSAVRNSRSPEHYRLA